MLFAGTYTVTIVDGNGCNVYTTFTIEDPCEISGNQWTQPITNQSARLNWAAVSGSVFNSIRGRVQGGASWTNVGPIAASSTFKDVFGLNNNTTYEWLNYGLLSDHTY